MDEDPQSSNRFAWFPSSLKIGAQEGAKDYVKETVKAGLKVVGAALGVVALSFIPILNKKPCLPVWALIGIGAAGIVVGTILRAYFARKRERELCARFEEQKAGLQGEIQSLKKQIDDARPEAETLKDGNDLHERVRRHLEDVFKLSVDRPAGSKPARALSISTVAIDHFQEIARTNSYGVTHDLLNLLVSFVLDERRGSSDSVYRLNELVYIVSRFEPAENAFHLPDRVRQRAGGVSLKVGEGEELPRWSVSAGVAEVDVPRESGNDVDQRIRNALESAMAAMKEAASKTNTVRVVRRSP